MESQQQVDPQAQPKLSQAHQDGWKTEYVKGNARMMSRKTSHSVVHDYLHNLFY